MARILAVRGITRAFAPDIPGGNRLLFKTRFSPGHKFECQGYERMGWDHKVHLTLKVRPKGSSETLYLLPYEIDDDAWRPAGLWSYYYERSFSASEGEDAKKMMEQYAKEIETYMLRYMSADLRSIV